MQSTSLPFSRDLVLVGGGHTHALVLRKWAMDPLPGARVTIIDPNATAAYSGMLPGHVAGHYTRAELDIDLVRLSQFAGARFVQGRACAVDRGRGVVQVEGLPDIGYDVLSLDVGITSRMPDLPGFAEYGVPAKPLGPFAQRWAAFRDGSGPAQVVILGGGVAGVELAMAMAHGLRAVGRAPEVTILERDTALTAVGGSAAVKLRAAMRAAGVTLRENCAPVRLHSGAVELEDGSELTAGFVTGAAGAHPYPWLAQSGLTDEAGFVEVDARLRTRDGSIFAVGDCAEMVETPRAKAGVYAVRQAPVLLNNLRATLSGAGGLRPYVPQKDYLKLISLGEKSAQAEKFGIALAGPALWRWKDRIDRKFMAQFDDLPAPEAPDLPWPRAAGAASEDKPLCGGCGSKLGRAVLQSALGETIGDDSAVLDTGGAQQVISTDHLRGFLADPLAMTRIAAVHALGDIWAMGAAPQAALAQITLPRQTPELAERHMAEIMETARAVMGEAGAEIVGGHSTMGAELIVGFTVTGLCERAPITLAGARPGDRLILTKPLGSGVLMAAHMRHAGPGADIAACLARMAQPQGAASELLRGASAMTDVTGFGLAGHLRNICEASGVGARIMLRDIPLLKGALDLSEKGVRSSLYAQNRAGFEDLADDGPAALLFDPQTAGGLLAAIGGDADAICRDLRQAGFEAAVIGEVTDAPGQIEIV
ncbi:selenophosphate synthase [Litoreibacter ponti]|uniref:Selenophosphate synthase n=1 Tax=Litoreibacter ponti TaxID=1510457 RepID=A0A2T6BDQ0_9RHOB|nr:selenide, water dikinase SelD [Litoreibacter ponti]PTX54195.1 selenophosphate synthase [Litoreibacter ponti]